MSLPAPTATARPMAMATADGYGPAYVGMVLLLSSFALQALLWRRMPQFHLHHSRGGRFIMQSMIASPA